MDGKEDFATRVAYGEEEYPDKRIAELEQQNRIAGKTIEMHCKTIQEQSNKLTQLRAERDRCREALQEIIDHDKRAWHVIAIAKKALEDSDEL